MKEVTKPNDIFASVLLNPTADIPDMLANGVNGANTDLLAADDYKKSKFVQLAFMNKEGVFDTEKFNNIYNFAQLKYNELQAVLLYSDLSNYTQYNQNDIYAPIQSLKTEKNYEMKRVKNPLRISEGVTSLFGKGEAEYSNRELAQMHKVWDSENEKWLDYTAEDQGFLGLKYLGRKSLVYAKWDEDGVHFDKLLGREVRHRKGEWKTDDSGQYYTETIGKNLGYGKEFVAYSDILTKEDSWANNIDFFDSDDKNKSVAGTIVKTAAGILPYLFPGFREVWGGITAAVALSSVLPTFAKMAEGVVLGDKETGFTKAMNSIENYFNKFDDSHSDAGKASMINFETIMGTIGDVYGQLYQMRAAASLSNLYTKQFTKAQEKSYKAFADKFRVEWAKANAANPKEFSKNPNAFQELWRSLADNTPEMKDLIKRLSQLSKSLSLGYMAMTSSADVYEDAILGGYDRRMAGLAGFLATAGQFGIMYNNRLGDWFLDATTGYKSDVSRSVMRNTLRPYYDKIAEASNKLTSKIPTEEKVSILSKLYTGIFKDGPKKLHNLLVYGGEELWKKGLIEGVEEVTEEAVMDATKGVFDTLSAIGIGKNAETASFGGWNNVFSSQGALRYLMSFIGGTLGGSLFELQRTKIQPAIDAAIYKKTPPDVRYSLIQEIMNGNTNELMEEIDRMCANDTQTIVLGDTNSEKPLTRGEVIADVLKQYIRFVEGTVVDEGIPLNELTGDKLIKKVVRTKMLQPVIEESGLLDMISSDFTKMVDDFVALKMLQGEKIEVEDKDKNEDKKESKQDKETKTEEYKVSDTLDSTIQKQLDDKKLDIINFLNGEKEEEYLKIALLYLHPDLRAASLGIDKYSWTKSKYNIDYSTLPEVDATLSKQQIDKEYAEWKEKADDLEKFRTIGVTAFDEMEKEFSPVFEEYAESMYGDIRKITMDTLLRDSNFTIGALIQNQDWRNSLQTISNSLKNAKLKGVSLEDILSIGNTTKTRLIDSIINTNKDYFSKVAEELNKANLKLVAQWETLSDEIKLNILKPDTSILSAEDVENLLKTKVTEKLQSLPLEEITPLILDNLLLEVHHSFSEILTKKLFESLGEVSLDEAKLATDKMLIDMGYSPINESLTGDPMTTIAKYISLITAPKTSIAENINLVALVLEEYLSNNNIIDGEIARKVKQLFYKEVEKHASEFINLLSEDEFESMYIDDVEASFKFKDLRTVLPLLFTRLAEGLDNNEDLTTIVLDWLFGPNGVVDVASEKYQLFKSEIMPDVETKSVNLVVDKMNNLPTSRLYEIVKSKPQKNNPLFEKLRTFGMKVFDGQDMILFDLLLTESDYMSQLPNIFEYIRQGITKEAIDNFISKLELLEAVIIGMEDSGINPEHQIAYNIQLRTWNEKWKKGNADKYKTISTHDVSQIKKDIDLLINKLVFAKTLIETNTDSKRGEDKKIQKHIEEAIVGIVKEAGELKIEGVSILPPQDELEKKEDSTSQLSLIEHTLYTKVQALIQTGHSVEKIIPQILEAFKVNKSVILDSGLLSNGLTKDAPISPYDFFVWLTTSLALDSYEFLSKYKEVLKKDEYKFVPFYVLEEGAKILYSFATDNKGIHNSAVKWLYSDMPNTSTQEASNIFFLNGIAGAGKSTAVMAVVKAMLGGDIWVVAPNKNQADKLLKSLQSLSELEEGTPVYDKYELLSQFLTDEGLRAVVELSNKPNTEGGSVESIKTDDGSELYRAQIKNEWIKDLDKKSLPAYIFIDEATHFNLAELKALDVFAKKYGIKVISAGDTLQKGASINGQPSNINDIFTWKSPAMTISVRSTNIHKKKNIETLLGKLRQIESILVKYRYDLTNPEIQSLLSDLIQVDYYQNDSDLHGDKLVDSIEVEDLKIIKSALSKGGKTLAIISEVDASGKLTDLNLVAKLQTAGLTENNYIVYSPDDFSAYAVQGAEANYVIINDMPPASQDGYQNMINFYTYLSRSLDGSLIKAGNYKSRLSLQSRLLSYTSDYSIPGIDDLVKFKQEKIESIEKIIEGYTPPAKSEPKKSIPSTNRNASTRSIAIDDMNERREVEGLIAQGEATTSTKEPANQFEANPLEWKPDSLYGYSFYNRTGIRKDLNGNHYSLSNNTSMDMDGLFGDKSTFVNKSIVRGFIKFKNLLALYTDNEEQLLEGLDDGDILAFFWRINPAISDAPDKLDRRNETLEYLRDNLQIDKTVYVFGKKYNSLIDASDMTVDSNPNAVEDGDLWMGYGRRVICKDPSGKIWLNQFITTGALPKPETLAKWGILAEPYIELRNKASETIQKTGKVAVFKLPSSAKIEKASGLQVRKAEDKNKFITLRAMLDDYGIQFIKDSNDEPLVYLIDGTKRSTVDGITSFDFLHFIAKTEATDKGYAERINLLESAYVKDGKLTVSGKYFTIGKFTSGSDTEYNRVLILESDGWTYLDALNFLRDLSQLTWDSKNDRDKQGSILERKAQAMSHSSLMRLLQGMFYTLGCVDENGNAIGEGAKPYVEYTLEFIQKHFEGQLLLDKMSAVLEREEKSENPTYGMTFVSNLLKESRYGGLLLMDTHLTVNKDSVKVRLLPESENDTRRDTRDLEFDLDSYSFREFEVKRMEYEEGDLYHINLSHTDYNHIGLSGHFLLMPQFKINQEVLGQATLVDSKLVRESVDYSNLELEEEKVPKQVPTTESFAELKKMFNPETDITRTVPSKTGKFYHKLSAKTLTKEEARSRFKYTTKADETNGFLIRIGDTIQIYGDTTHTYRISWIDKKRKYFEYDIKDGKLVQGLKKDKYIPFNAVSAIVGREYSYTMPIDNDYYQSDAWIEQVKAHKYTRSKKSKVISELNFSDSDIEALLKRYPTLVVYAVTNDDDSVLSPLIRANETLQDGFDTTSVGIYPATTVEDVRNHINDLSSIDNINGIVLVGLFGEGIAKFTTNRKEFLANISESYIQKYISFTENPKYTESIKDKQSDQPKKATKPETLLDKAVKLLEQHKTTEGLKEKLQELVSANTAEELSDFSTTKWFIYNEGNKWYVYPNVSVLSKLSNEAKLLIIDSIPTVALNVGEVVTIRKNKSIETYEGTITGYDSTTHKYKISYEMNGVSYTAERDKTTIELLWDVAYEKSSTQPAPIQGATVEAINSGQSEHHDLIMNSRASAIMNALYRDDKLAQKEFVGTSIKVANQLGLDIDKVQQQLAEYIELGQKRNYSDLRQLWSVSSDEDLLIISLIIEFINNPITQVMFNNIDDMFDENMLPKEC